MNKNKLLSLFILTMLSLTTYAYDFEVDGLFYNLVSASDKTCELVGCSENVTDLVIPESVSTRGLNLTVMSYKSDAFTNNTRLQNLTFNSKITAVANSSFSGCTSLSSVVLPNSIKSIRNKAFYNCPIETITIPNSVDTLGLDAINKVKRVIIEDGENAIRTEGPAESMTYLYMGRDIDQGFHYYIEHINGRSYCDIFKATSLCSRLLEEVEIGDNVSAISNYLFAGCTKLQYLKIPASVLEIGDCAFNDCTRLNQLIIEDSEQSLKIGIAYDSNHSFYDVEGYYKVFLYEYGLFYRCNLTNIYIGRNMRLSYDKGNKSDRQGLYSEMISQGYRIRVYHTILDKKRGMSLFSQKTIENVTFGAKVNSLCEYMFKEQEMFETFTLPENCDSIGDYCFEGCTNLKKIDIGNATNVYIGKYAFNDCKSLSKLDFTSGVKKIDSYSFNGCSGLKNVILGDDVKELGEYSFNGCNIHRLEIGNGITEVPENCFKDNNSLQWVSLGENVSTIQNGAFEGCNQIHDIGCKNPVPPTFSSKSELNAVNKFDATIYIPQGTISAYEQASIWKDFLFKEEKEIPEYVYTFPKPDETGSGSNSMTINGDLTEVQIAQINNNASLETLNLQNATLVLGKTPYKTEGKRLPDNSTDADVIRNPGKVYMYITAPYNKDDYETTRNANGKVTNYLYYYFRSDLEEANLNGNIKTLTLPASLTSFGKNAIVGSNLTDLYVLSATPPTASSTSFGSTNKSTCVLHVPAGCKNVYAKAYGWSGFNNIVEMEVEPIEPSNRIKVQPTNDKPTVQLAATDDKAEYQWFTKVERYGNELDCTESLKANGWKWENGAWISNNHDDTSMSTLEMNVNLKKNDHLSFDWSVNSESTFDQLQCMLGDDMVFAKSGDASGSIDYTLEKDSNGKMSFVYIKDGSVSEGTDRATLSNIKLSSEQGLTYYSGATIEGETSTTLNKLACNSGDYVWCRITLGDGTTLYSDTIQITYKSVEEIKITPDQISLETGKKEKLIATVLPADAYYTELSWSSSDNNIATVSTKGEISGIGVGSCVITATSGNVSATCEVTVTPIYATSVELNKSKLNLLIGSSETLTAIVLPEKAVDKSLTWSSSDETIATVSSDGEVTAINMGEATIKVSTESGLIAECDVKVFLGKPEAVDLGLPSGVLWATFNVGTFTPDEPGDTFVWGALDTETQWNDIKNDLAGITEISNTEYDVAKAKWGNGWRMPTKDDAKELIEKCTITRFNLRSFGSEIYPNYGYADYEVKGPNGNCIFFNNIITMIDVPRYMTGTLVPKREEKQYWINIPFKDVYGDDEGPVRCSTKMYVRPVTDNPENAGICDNICDNSISLVVYNLSGQKVLVTTKRDEITRLSQGIYIVNGKKMLVK